MLTMMGMNEGKKKLTTLALTSLLGILFAYFLLNSYIYNQKQASQTIFAPYEGALNGEYTCLPHKNTKGPQTEECAFGIKTVSGEYFAINYQEENIMMDFQSGKSAELTGRITPIELISSDQWKNYNIEGIISVNSESGFNNPEDGAVVNCTMEAKECPDGSFVGRGGPDCEFAACPGEEY